MNAPSAEFWLELFLALGAASALAIGLAEVIARPMRGAAEQRAVCHAALLALLLLLALELTGAGRAAIYRPFDAWSQTAPAAAKPAPGWGLSLFVDLSLSVEPQAAFPAPAPAAPSPPALDTVALDPAAITLLETLGVARPAAPAGALVLRAAPSAAPVSAPAPAPTGGSWWPGILWLAGSVVVLGRCLGATLLLAAFRLRRRPLCDSDLHDLARRLAAGLRLRRPVRLQEAPGLSSPIAFGVLRPTVALPASFTRLDRGQQEAILAHELAHLAARDPAWQIVADVTAALFWWQPLVWWLRRKLRSACELAADDATAMVADGPSTLARYLVALCGGDRRARPAGLQSVEGGGFRSTLGRRVERLLGLPVEEWRPPGNARSWLVRSLGPALLVPVIVFGTEWARSQPEETLDKGGLDMWNVLQSSWRRSLGAMVLVAAVSGGGDGQAQAPPPAEESPPPAQESVKRRPDQKVPELIIIDDNTPGVTRASTLQEILTLRKRLAELERKLEKQADPTQIAEENEATDPLVPRAGGADSSPRGGRLPGAAGPRTGTRRAMAGAGLPGVGDSAGRPGGPAMGHGGQVDLVSLATAVADAAANVQITRLQHDRLSRLAQAATVSKEEAAIAELNWQAAGRKLALLRHIAQAMLQASEAELQGLEAMRQDLKKLYEVGQTTAGSVNSLNANVAAERARLDALRYIIEEAAQGGASNQGKK